MARTINLLTPIHPIGLPAGTFIIPLSIER